MYNPILVSCECCGISKLIPAKEFYRKLRNQGLFFCSKSCGAKFLNKRRQDPQEVKDNPQVKMAKQITLAKDPTGNYMPLEWVKSNITRLIPEVNIQKLSEESIANKRSMWTNA